MRLRRMVIPVLQVLVAIGAITLPTSGQAPQEVRKQRVTLRSGAFIDVSDDWMQLTATPPPPPPQLARSAPQVTFLELVALENPKTHSALRIATTTNPFAGQDEVALDAQMHGTAGSGKGLIDYLFYFFFPPPRDCLDGGAAAYNKAKTQPNGDQNATPDSLNVRTDCHHSPTITDFYSSQVSPGVEFEVANSTEKVVGTYRDFYLSPMEKVEANGMTFYVFEAQGQTQLSLATVNHFNFPDELQGAQTDYFWAIGTTSPFPFSVDPQRKNVAVLQVIYAGVGLGANKRENFMRLLRQVQMP